MHLIEVLIAGGVFTIASGSSVQLWSAMAVHTHQLTAREQLEQQIEQDRLLLQTLWRSNAPTAQTLDPSMPNQQGAAQESAGPSTSGCQITAAELLAQASTHSPASSLQRTLQLSPDGRSLRMQWNGTGTPQVLRNRVVTPAGLGLCGLEAAEPEVPTSSEAPSASDNPLTESQVEHVPS